MVKKLLAFIWNFLCSILCLLSFILLLAPLPEPGLVSHTSAVHEKAEEGSHQCFSPGWAAPDLSAFPRIVDAPSPSSPLWPSTGLSLELPCLSWIFKVIQNGSASSPKALSFTGRLQHTKFVWKSFGIFTLGEREEGVKSGAAVGWLMVPHEPFRKMQPPDGLCKVFVVQCVLKTNGL